MSYCISVTLQSNFVQVTVWKDLRNILVRCNWISVVIQFWKVLQYFDYEANEIRLRHAWKTSWNICNGIQLNFGSDTFWKHVRVILVGFNGISVINRLKIAWKIFNKIQLNLSWDATWKRLRIISVGCHWVSPRTHFGNALQQFWYDASRYGLGDTSKT